MSDLFIFQSVITIKICNVLRTEYIVCDLTFVLVEMSLRSEKTFPGIICIEQSIKRATTFVISCSARSKGFFF